VIRVKFRQLHINEPLLDVTYSLGVLATILAFQPCSCMVYSQYAIFYRERQCTGAHLGLFSFFLFGYVINTAKFYHWLQAQGTHFDKKFVLECAKNFVMAFDFRLVAVYLS
jgi:hypothetical protein